MIRKGFRAIPPKAKGEVWGLSLRFGRIGFQTQWSDLMPAPHIVMTVSGVGP